MTNWIYKIVIRDLLKPYDDRDDMSVEEVRDLAQKVATRLRESACYKDVMFKFVLRPIIKQFENDVYTMDDFEEVLDELYNFGDDNRVWIGNSPLEEMGIQ